VDKACPDRVLEDVFDRVGEVVVVLDDPGGEARAEEVAPALVAAVEGLRVDAVEAAHAVGEAPELGLDDQVVVVRHQAEGVDAPVVALDGLGEQGEEEAVFVGCQEGGGLRHAARGHVVDAFGRQGVPRTPQRGRP
jgi:hypothetical protein